MKLRKADLTDVDDIWEILQYAIEKRRQEGSEQWQDGYPNEGSVRDDIENGYGYLLEEDGLNLAYAAIIFEKEPAYEAIKGRWLTNGDYVVLHRVAVSAQAAGQGAATHLFQLVEELSLSNDVQSIKVDTNYDNPAMLRILQKLGYTYCGEVFFRGSARKAFEKVLSL